MKSLLWPLSACLTFLAAAAHAHDWSWEPGTITGAEVRKTDKLPHLGAYLYVTRKNLPPQDPDKGVWNMAKMNIPERWKVSSVTIGERVVTLLTSAGRFEITSGNLEFLMTAIGELGRNPPTTPSNRCG